MYFFDDHHMSYHSDSHNPPRDVRWMNVGTGLLLIRSCMGCGQRRDPTGGKGKAGPRWRCAQCVAAKQARAA